MREAENNGRTQDQLRRGVVESPGDGDQPAGALEQSGGGTHMVGTSLPMRAVFETIRKYAATDALVLITGESGTGKELTAIAIHERSGYKTGPFYPINCGGLPSTLIASELFGYEKGAFTGAFQRHIGRIEAARGGSVLLDEIGDLPLELQGHLLRFVEEKTIDRLGGRRPIHVDVRIIAATNQDLRKAVAEGRFRRDLFYRLSVLSLEMPPLRERSDDIDLLCTYFLRQIADELNRSLHGFEPSALRAMRRHEWPGNVRELVSTIRRAVVMAEGDRITESDLGICESEPNLPDYESRASDTIRASLQGRRNDYGVNDELPNFQHAKNEFEGAFIREALQRYDHQIKLTAGKLDISRVTLHRLMKKHGIGRS